MNWAGKKVLVTGAGGFIGSHLVERLVEFGAEVRGFLRYNSRNDEGHLRVIPEKIRKEIEIIVGDIQELETMHRVTKGVKIIFHLAASVGIPYSYVNPQEVIAINTIGTLNALTAAREADVEKFIQTSTSEVYGTAKYVPIDEAHPKQPQSPYSASKIAADAIALSFYNSFDFPVGIIRPFNTFGPRQSDRAIIPSIISQVLTGKNVRIGNTTPTRDFTFVTDTAAAFMRMAESDRMAGKEINIGSGQEISIGELAQKIVSLMGRKTIIESDVQRIRPKKSEVERLCASNLLAKEILGWEPTVSLTEGLTKTIQFISRNPAFYFPQKYRI
ncbi:MAG: GDP-mannose 4,6-dehydratase [Thermodesulfobacteriota bacterium]